MVRTKISQSSALRQKRGHTAVNERPGCKETETLVGLNNNRPYAQAGKNGIIHSNGTSVEPEFVCDQIEELKSINTDSNEEESLTTDSLSEVSKFESMFLFCDFPLANP